MFQSISSGISFWKVTCYPETALRAAVSIHLVWNQFLEVKCPKFGHSCKHWFQSISSGISFWKWALLAGTPIFALVSIHLVWNQFLEAYLILMGWFYDNSFNPSRLESVSGSGLKYNFFNIISYVSIHLVWNQFLEDKYIRQLVSSPSLFQSISSGISFWKFAHSDRSVYSETVSIHLVWNQFLEVH